MYAVGRNVQYYDAPAVRGAANDAYAFASLVKASSAACRFRCAMTAPAEQAAPTATGSLGVETAAFGDSTGALDLDAPAGA